MSDIDQAAGETQDNPGENPKPDKPKRPRRRGRPHKRTDTEHVSASEAARPSDETGESATHENDSIERAERIVQEWTVRAEQVGMEIGHQVVKLFARAREEAEDIWAEAQVIRQRQDQHPDQKDGERD